MLKHNKKYTSKEVDEICEMFEFVITTCNNEPKQGFDRLQVALEEEGDYVAEFVGNDSDGFTFCFYTEEQRSYQYHNADLKVALMELIDLMHETETETTKMAVSKECDDTLSNSFSIDVEHISFFYSSEKERDEDYAELMKVLTDESISFSYLV